MNGLKFDYDSVPPSALPQYKRLPNPPVSDTEIQFGMKEINVPLFNS